jgi:glycosyltransferase involved in cell wall biosynthesis
MSERIDPRPARAQKITIVMPARNAATTLEHTVGAIPPEWVDEILLVDDHSSDATIEVANRLGLRVVWHPHNVGYGGNQKTCYLDALNRGADIVVMLHPDGQYQPELIPDIVRPIIEGRADLVLGSRLLDPDGAIAGGMPRWKYAANRFLTIIENRVLGTDLAEFHTGYRAYSRDMLLGVPFLRNALDFSFDSEMLFQAVSLGFRLEEVPVRTIYHEEASSVDFKAGVIYGTKTLLALGRLGLHRRGIWRSRKYEPVVKHEIPAEARA